MLDKDLAIKTAITRCQSPVPLISELLDAVEPLDERRAVVKHVTDGLPVR